MQLHIADPCHENWDNMTPSEQGRFCDACRKQVIDFSEMSDRQIVQFFKKPSTGSVCGRFMSEQLDRDMVIEKKRLPWIKYFFQFALPAFLMGKEVQAQYGSCRKPSTAQTRPVSVKQGMIQYPVMLKTKLWLQVKNAATGEPVPYASVVVSGDETKKVASKDGIVTVNIDSKAKNAIITVSSIGYKAKTITQELSTYITGKVLDVELEIDPIKMEELVVVNTIPGTVRNNPSRHVVGALTSHPGVNDIRNALAGRVAGPVVTSTTNPGPTLFKPFVTPPPIPGIFICSVPGITILGDPVVEKEVKDVAPVKTIVPVATTIYPNPIKRGKPVTVTVEATAEQTIRVRVMATDGKMLIIHKQSISKGNNRFTINTDPAWTAGIYFLVFSDEKGLVLKTEELVVQ